MKNLFEAGILSATVIVEKKYKKKLEKMELFFDYEKNILQVYFKFKDEPYRHAAEEQSLLNKDEKTLSDMLLGMIKKEIPDLLVIRYASLIIDAEAKKIEKTSVYYTNKIGNPRLFENPKNLN